MISHNETPREKNRLASLLELVPRGRRSLLDVGTRDGYILQHLVGEFETLTALDLRKPNIPLEQVCVQGDATRLEFPDDSFDTVLCTEVLEHIPPSLLPQACDEIMRVAKYDVVIGVPYKQDLRFDRATCASCGAHVHAWGHLNVFKETTLQKLFRHLTPISFRLIESNRDRTNFVSTFFMDLGKNPWGPYGRGQICSNCGSELVTSTTRSSFQKLCLTAAYVAHQVQRPFIRSSPTWLHVVFKKREFASNPVATTSARPSAACTHQN